MENVEKDFETFRRLAEPRVSHLRDLIDGERHDLNWIIRAVRSLDDFQREFPTVEARARAIRRVEEVDQVRMQVLQRLDQCLETFMADRAQ